MNAGRFAIIFLFLLAGCNLDTPVITPTVAPSPLASFTPKEVQRLISTILPSPTFVSFPTATSTSSPTETVVSTVASNPTKDPLLPTFSPSIEGIPSASTATSQPCEAIVSEFYSSISVRKGPDIEFDVIGFLYRGDRVTILGRNLLGTWWQIKLYEQMGWIASRLLVSSGDCTSVPVPQNIPTLPTLIPTATPILPANPLIPSGGHPNVPDPNSKETAEQENPTKVTPPAIPTEVPIIPSDVPISTLEDQSGPMDIGWYCGNALGYAGARPEDENDPYSWVCYDNGGNTLSVDLRAACEWQYSGRLSNPTLNPPGNAWSWSCNK